MGKYKIDSIKERISCRDYMIREHGSIFHGNRCVSFRPGADNKTSLSIDGPRWYDFGSGKGGDVIDLCAEDRFNGNLGEAIRYLGEACGLECISETPEIAKKANRYYGLLDDAVTFYSECLQRSQEQLDYLHKRGLRDDYIKAKRLGFAEAGDGKSLEQYLKGKGYTPGEINASGILLLNDRIIIPYLKNGSRCVYMVGRECHPSPAKYMKLKRAENGFSDHIVWGMESLYRDWKGEKVAEDSPIIIAEGAFDAMSFEQEGYSVLSAITGSFSGEQEKDLFPTLLNCGRKVIICMDYDPESHAGQKFTDKLSRKLFLAGVEAYPLFLKGNGKKVDISELYQGNPCRATLDAQIETAVSDYGTIFALKNCVEKPNIDAMKAFLRECRDSLPAEQKADYAANLQGVLEKSGFTKPQRQMLLKILTTPPSEQEILHDFKEKYDVLYKPRHGWFEWNRKNPAVWKRIDEDIVKSYVHAACGRFLTKKLQDAVFTLVKTDPDIVRGDGFEFNRNKDLFVFKNGTFNLATLDFTPSHRREDFCTIMVDYDYDPDADYPFWDQAITDITGDDEKRYSLLQEMFGYCLTADNEMQKSFCLIGDGSNGKSMLLKVLEELVGSDSCTHVEIASLKEEFQRIMLLNSKVNICNDMKSDVAGNESDFKAIVSGDPINGCYKGKDFIDFKPYCKIVFSTNAIPEFKECDDAILRRFSYIKFPVRFTDCPNESNGERKKDIHLEEKLMAELPGIFNWAVIGLRELRENGSFTETTDDREYKDMMIYLANPIIEWWEHFDSWRKGQNIPNDHVYTRAEVINHYVNFCKDNNQTPESEKKFWPHLRKIKSAKLDMSPRVGNSRGAKFG